MSRIFPSASAAAHRHYFSMGTTEVSERGLSEMRWRCHEMWRFLVFSSYSLILLIIACVVFTERAYSLRFMGGHYNMSPNPLLWFGLIQFFCDSIGDSSNTIILSTLLSLSQYVITSRAISKCHCPWSFQVSHLLHFVSVWFVCVFEFI